MLSSLVCLRSVRLLAVLLVSLAVAVPTPAQLIGKQRVSGTRAARNAKGPTKAAGQAVDSLDLEGLPAGLIISSVSSRNGAGPILIHGTNPAFPGGTNAAVIFDSVSPTGGDIDLGTPNQTFGGPGVGVGGEQGSPTANDRGLRNLLIVAEDLVDANNNLLVDDPDDSDLKGSMLTFDFSAIAPVTLTRINYLDIEGQLEDGAFVELFDQLGQSLAVFPLPPTGDNGRISLSTGPTAGVYSVAVTMNGSGAIDTLAFTRGCSGTIGDLLWHDRDCDGLQDAGEPGLQGVTILLLDVQGNTLDSTVTGQDGSYAFRGLCTGGYSVRVDESTLPPGWVLSSCRVGGNRALDSNCSPTVVTLISDQQTSATIDFGVCSPCEGTLGDFVWHDLDCDGVQDVGEPGLEGIFVRLFDGSGLEIAAQDTGPDGAYSFTGLCDDDYRVEVDASTLPPGFVPAPCGAGSDDTADSNCSPALVSLVGSDATDADTDFGFCVPCTGTIGNFVWQDLDCDGIQDGGEAGVQGVTVVLSDAQGARIASRTTGADGSYTFTGLCAGDYSVAVDADTLPPGFVEAPCEVGSNPAIDSSCGEVDVTLTTDASTDTTVDFGFCSPCTGRIGDFVWRDTNGDNLQGPGEPGIGGVVIVLRDDQQVVLAQTTTAPDGSYEFAGLCPGTYQVSFVPETAPNDLSPVLCDFGIDDDVDSDCSPATVVLTDTDVSVDFGFQACAPCSGGLIAMTLRYQGSETAFIEVRTEANCAPDDVFFSGTVTSLATFTFYGTAADGTFPKDIKVFVDGQLDTSIHTSCSQPVGPGTVYGSFEIVSASSRDGGTICSCGPCEGGLTSLTLVSLLPDVSYIVVLGDSGSGGGGKGSSGGGKGSKGSSGGGKGSSGGGKGSSGGGKGSKGSSGGSGGSGDEILFEGIVPPLGAFTFSGTGTGGKFPKDIRILVDDVEHTTIHTSCSQPVGPGTEHGDFLVIAGASKANGPICDSDVPTTGECVEGAGLKVQSLTCVYTGANDGTVVTQQSSGSHNVDDHNGGPSGAPLVYIVVRNPNKSTTWFAGTVALGASFTVDARDSGATKLHNQTFVEIYDAGGTTLLQLNDFHTSCSEPLTVNDRYGAIDIVGLGLIPK